MHTTEVSGFSCTNLCSGDKHVHYWCQSLIEQNFWAKLSKNIYGSIICVISTEYNVHRWVFKNGATSQMCLNYAFSGNMTIIID